ncbi:MAG TPA: penicillin-binding transpeptidase domain-containing protein, partial [Acidimicrobiales bacterium]
VTLQPQWRAVMLAGFKGVTAEQAGTARGAFIGFPLGQHPVAGKTGTAQVTGKQATSVFTSFAPADDPTYVVDAFLEQAGYGAESAAPVVRRIYEGLFGMTPASSVTTSGGID